METVLPWVDHAAHQSNGDLFPRTKQARLALQLTMDDRNLQLLERAAMALPQGKYLSPMLNLLATLLAVKERDTTVNNHSRREDLPLQSMAIRRRPTILLYSQNQTSTPNHTRSNTRHTPTMSPPKSLVVRLRTPNNLMGRIPSMDYQNCHL